MSKYIGEGEERLRALFEEARKCEPSLIFFDELDGLGPARASGSEQSMALSSIVTTMLALLDGFDARGSVFIIGATNCLEHLDPALRHPGRFGREIKFGYPSAEERASIFEKITTRWEQDKFTDTEIMHLGAITQGYSPADIKNVCATAFLAGVKNAYGAGLEVRQGNKLKIGFKELVGAVEICSPARKRSTVAAPLPPHLHCVLAESVIKITTILDKNFPKILRSKDESDVGLRRFAHQVLKPPRVLIAGEPSNGHSTWPRRRYYI